MVQKFNEFNIKVRQAKNSKPRETLTPHSTKMENQPSKDTPMKASCHCGAITLTVPGKPQEINDCQCTICRRYGAAWGYYNRNDVKFDIKEGAGVKKYVWGDGDHSFDFCDNCGCVCYWYPVDTSVEKDEAKPLEDRYKMGVNTRMMDPDLLRDVNRKMDVDQLFVPLTNTKAAHPEDRARY